MEQLVARRAHNPKVAGSSPVPATKRSSGVAVNMPACHAGDRGFDSRLDRHFRKGLVAQSVEQRTENPCVVGSIPTETTIEETAGVIICFFSSAVHGELSIFSRDDRAGAFLDFFDEGEIRWNRRRRRK